MADANTTQNLELALLAEKLNDLAAQLSVFKPVLVEINDNSDLPRSVYGQLDMIATLSEYINDHLGGIAVRLKLVAA